MSRMTIELRGREEQAALNLRRWDEVLADPELRKVPGRIETDRHGRIVMSPPPTPRHGRYQVEVAALLKKLMPNGVTISECPISTADGVRAADVAWCSNDRWLGLGNRAVFVQAPEICVEVVSPSNSEEELQEKMTLYFGAGALEVWICGAFGEMAFFGESSSRLKGSGLCPDFPSQL